MAETQTYRVETVYEISDKASKALGEIEKSAKKTADSTSSLKTMILSLGGAAIVQRSWGALKHAIIDGNVALEQHRVQLAGITAMTTGASLEKTWERSAISMERFKEFSWQSGTAIGDIAKAATAMNTPLLQAGLKMSQIESLAHEVGKVSGAFDMDAGDVAGRFATAIATGRGLKRDMFMRGLFSQAGMNVNFDKFQTEMTGSQRAKLLQQALGSQNIQAFIAKQSDETWGGIVGNIKSHLSNLAETAGKPLFEAAVKELAKIQQWIENNRPKLEEMGRAFGQHLMTAFGFFKDLGQTMWPLIKDALSVVREVMSFASEHRDVLMNVAKGLLVYKGVQIGGRAVAGGFSDAKGFLGGIFGAEGLGGLKDIGSGFGAAKDGSSNLASAFGTLLTKMPGVIGAFAKIAGIGYVAGGLMFGKTEAEKARDAKSAEQMKTAKDIADARARVQELEGKLQSFAPGQDVRKAQFASPALQQWQEQLKELSGGLEQKKIDLLNRSIKEGFVGETIENGRRKLTLAPTSASVDQTNIAGHKALYMQLKEVFVQGAQEAEAERMKAFGTALYDPLAWGKAGQFFSEAITAKTVADIDEGLQAKPPIQNVNINIQQVSAKDPNKWLADMDDMVARRTRAKTGAKRQFKSSPQ